MRSSAHGGNIAEITFQQLGGGLRRRGHAGHVVYAADHLINGQQLIFPADPNDRTVIARTDDRIIILR